MLPVRAERLSSMEVLRMTTSGATMNVKPRSKSDKETSEYCIQTNSRLDDVGGCLKSGRCYNDDKDPDGEQHGYGDNDGRLRRRCQRREHRSGRVGHEFKGFTV
ncbi:Hypp404 [Branchiostoma lanceolatum]|uniref:Hypp404 protein n=1 Tax=Branchiostoma lanceolatum TaxID=7740 RepID=A0A8J9VAL9_BRALA|nr:Hypp404 [Branchiostoma lanceolatum]